MYKLGLIGKNISHSLSPAIYQEILSANFSYDLLDYQHEKDIPPISELAKKYFGLNITAPYKKFFINDVSVADGFSAINCLSFKDGQLLGTNTDYFACEEILMEISQKYDVGDYVVLGDGTMSEIIIKLLLKQKISFLQHTRKKYVGDFTQLNLSTHTQTTLVINTCAREFLFAGKLNKKTIFWDLNYKMESSEYISSQSLTYIDGYDLLKRQAIHATKFWGLS